ncbi:hypothetical protein DPV78_001093, partial [Talaromyces pinophilus]
SKSLLLESLHLLLPIVFVIQNSRYASSLLPYIQFSNVSDKTTYLIFFGFHLRELLKQELISSSRPEMARNSLNSSPLQRKARALAPTKALLSIRSKFMWHSLACYANCKPLRCGYKLRNRVANFLSYHICRLRSSMIKYNMPTYQSKFSWESRFVPWLVVYIFAVGCVCF